MRTFIRSRMVELSNNTFENVIYNICFIYNISANERGKNGGTVILNVGGKIHQVRWETIDKFPKSRLQRIRYATSEGETLS